jgi:hypothetical protein
MSPKVQQRLEEEELLREKVKKQRAELAAQRAREEEEEKQRREVLQNKLWTHLNPFVGGGEWLWWYAWRHARWNAWGYARRNGQHAANDSSTPHV